MTWLYREPCSKKSLYLDSGYYEELIDKTEDVAAVFLFDFPAVPFSRILKKCRGKGIPVISDVTEWFNTRNMRLLEKPFKAFDTFLRMRVLNKKADGIVCISHGLMDYYRKRKCVFIPPLMPQKENPPEHERIDASFSVCFAGQTGKGKDRIGPFLCFLLSERPMDFRFHVFGSSPDLDGLDDKDPYIAEHIKVHGTVSHDRLLEELAHMDLQLVVRDDIRSNRMGFSTKFAESCSLGLPCIVTPVGELKRLVVDGVNGFVIPSADGDYGALLDSIRSCDIASIRNEAFHLSSVFDEGRYVDSMHAFLVDCHVVSEDAR